MSRNLIVSAFLGLLAASAFAQPDFAWQRDLALPYTDPNGQKLTGTEVVHLVTHKGKLYAGNSYWNEYDDPRRGQVWVKPAANGAWIRDFEMPAKHSRVPSLYSFTFSHDQQGNAISPDTLLFAGATYDKGSNISGPAVVFVRNDATGAWLAHNLGYTNHSFDYTQVRSMGFHRDKVTGADIVFAGANPAPTGVYAGRYNASIAGKISWDATPEFEPDGYQRIMGFAVCNDTLYMATQREVYKRIDGPSPQWIQVLTLSSPTIINTYGTDLDPYWLNDEDIRCFRTIQAPDGSGEVLMFGALNHIFRLHPQQGYALIPEQDIEEVLETSTGSDFHYLQTQLIVDYPVPGTNETVQLIGFEAFYDTTFLAQNPQPNLGGFNQQGWYFIRRQVGTTVEYYHREIIDWAVQPQPDSLARVRTFCLSPFASDSGKVIYSGGFAPWFIGDVSKTAWVYKGTFQPEPAITGFIRHPDLAYGPLPEQKLDVYVPNGGPATKPVMVYVHGGSWRTGQKEQTGYKDDWFTSKGYIFVSVDYRLSPNPVNITDPSRVMYPIHPQDVSQAIAWVFANIGTYSGDTARVSLIGHSAGAHLVSLVSTDSSFLLAGGIALNRIKCTCSLDAGGHDIPYYLNKYQQPGDSQWITYQNAFGTDTALWRTASPYAHVAANKGIPDFMLVHQGTAQRVDLHQHFGSKLAASGIPVTYLNAYPLDHEGINGTLGSPQTAVQPYNDSVALFFSHCLAQKVSRERDRVSLQPVLSPNPAAEVFTLLLDASFDLSQTVVEIRTLKGQLIRRQTITSHSTTLDVSELPAGMYLIQLVAKGKTDTRRLIKR